MSLLSLFVIGHSPAILLETLAARFQQGQEVPDDIVVVTTASGAENLKHALFVQGGWQHFCASYPAMQAIDFTERKLRYIEGMDDIRTQDENNRVSTMIFSEVKQGIEAFDRVDASLAGGRKTMGYYLGLAMSLFARDYDTLTHVLAPPEWERDRAFLFPEPDEAHRIALIEVPFIRFRLHMLPIVHQLDVETLVSSAQHAFDSQKLEPISIIIKQRKIRFHGRDVVLKEREFSIYLFFARQKSKHCVHPERATCGACRDCFLSHDGVEERKEELLEIRGLFGGVDSGNYERFEKAWRTPRAAQSNLSEPLNRIKQAVVEVFGLHPCGRELVVENVGKRGQALYGLMADKSQIREERG